MGNENEVPASAPSPAAATAPAPKKKSWLKRLLKLGVFLVVLVVVLIIVGPSIASATFLTGTVKKQLQGVFGEGADVTKVSFGWSQGLVVDGIKVPAASWARVKDRPVITLEHVGARFSVPGTASAAMSGGEIYSKLEAEKAKVYLELLPGGKTNVPIATPDKPAESKPAGTKPADTKPADTKPADTKPADSPTAGPAKPLPVSLKSVMDVRAFDVEIADMTSSTGTVQRTILTGLRMGCVASVAKDMTATIDTIKEGATENPTFAFDKLEIWTEPKDGPKTLTISVVSPKIVPHAAFAGPRAASADQAPIKALQIAHQLDAKPVFTVQQVAGKGYDLRDLNVTMSVNAEGGHKTAAFQFTGVMKGPKHDGKIKLATTADLQAKPKLPANLEISLVDVDIAGVVAETSPTLLPILGGCLDPNSKENLPTLTFDTKGGVGTCFDKDEKVDKDPTLNSILSDGSMKLGPGSLAGSTILKGFLEAFNKLELQDMLMKAIGDQGLNFDSVEEVFNVKEGVVTIPKLRVLRKNLGIDLEGTCTFNGHYKFAMHMEPDTYGRMKADKSLKDAGTVLECVDKAGGIGIEGDLGGSYTLTLPPADALARQLAAAGAIDSFRSHCPKGAARLDGELSKYGLSMDQIAKDPKAAASDVAHKQADTAEKKGEAKAQQELDKQLDKNGTKIADKTGIDVKKTEGDLINKLKGDKPDEKKDEKKPDEKKDDKSPLPVPVPKIPNPFGG